MLNVSEMTYSGSGSGKMVTRERERGRGGGGGRGRGREGGREGERENKKRRGWSGLRKYPSVRFVFQFVTVLKWWLVN